MLRTIHLSAISVVVLMTACGGADDPSTDSGENALTAEQCVVNATTAKEKYLSGCETDYNKNIIEAAKLNDAAWSKVNDKERDVDDLREQFKERISPATKACIDTATARSCADSATEFCRVNAGKDPNDFCKEVAAKAADTKKQEEICIRQRDALIHSCYDYTEASVAGNREYKQAIDEMEKAMIAAADADNAYQIAKIVLGYQKQFCTLPMAGAGADTTYKKAYSDCRKECAGDPGTGCVPTEYLNDDSNSCGKYVETASSQENSTEAACECQRTKVCDEFDQVLAKLKELGPGKSCKVNGEQGIYRAIVDMDNNVPILARLDCAKAEISAPTPAASPGPGK